MEAAQVRQAVGHEAAADDEDALVAQRPQAGAELQQRVRVEAGQRDLQHGHVGLGIHGHERHVGAVVEAAGGLVRYSALAPGELRDALR